MDTNIKIELTIVNKKTVCTRKFKWNLKSLRSPSYNLSEYFDILLEDRTNIN